MWQSRKIMTFSLNMIILNSKWRGSAYWNEKNCINVVTYRRAWEALWGERKPGRTECTLGSMDTRKYWMQILHNNIRLIWIGRGIRARREEARSDTKISPWIMKKLQRILNIEQWEENNILYLSQDQTSIRLFSDPSRLISARSTKINLRWR